jgi:hypothetical protein
MSQMHSPNPTARNMIVGQTLMPSKSTIGSPMPYWVSQPAMLGQ